MSDEVTIKEIVEFYIEENNSLKDTSVYFGMSSKRINNLLKKNNIIKDPDKKKEAALISRRKTCIEKYGVDNPSKSNQVKNKIKSTFKEKYGVDNPFKSESIKVKIKDSLLSKYGVEHPMYSKEIKDRLKNTNLKKYGVENVFQNEDIKRVSKETLKEKYGVEHPSLSGEIRKKAENTLMDKYGVNNPGLMNEHRDKILTSSGIKKIDGVPITILSEELGVSPTTIYRWDNKYDLNINSVKSMADKSSKGFSSLELYFEKEFNLNKWNRNPNDVVKYRPDFRLTDNVYINTDGLYWHSELNLDKRYHFNMRKEYEDNNLRIFQFRADEIYNKTLIVRSMINNVKNKSKRIWARKTKAMKVSNSDAKKFLEENHLMGYKSSKNIGLYLKNELVSLISYKASGTTLKVERFCSKLNIIVVGGLSKLLSFITKHNKISSIESWVDLRYGTGKSLEKNGFSLKKETLGWKWTDFNKTYNRLRCRANMDNRGLSEKEHAQELGWCKIYDAGQRLYIKEIQ